MTSDTTSEPIRLLEQAGVPEGERSLLEAGRSCAPVNYDVTAGAARFRAQLAALAAAGAIAGTAGSNAGAGGKALLAKLGFKIALGFTMAAAFAGAGLVAGMHLAATSSHGAVAPAPPRIEVPSPVLPPVSAALSPSAAAAPPPPVERAVPSEDAPARRAPSRPVAQEPHRGALAPTRGAPGSSAPVLSHDDPAGGTVNAPAATANVAPPLEAPAASVAPAPPVPSAKPTAQPSQPLSEIRAVALARDLVDTDPQAALALLDQTQREHPTGYFVEERQALTVMALVRAGRQATARQQGVAFLRAYPNGPFSDRVRSVTGL
jgi:lysophospholipase